MSWYSKRAGNDCAELTTMVLSDLSAAPLAMREEAKLRIEGQFNSLHYKPLLDAGDAIVNVFLQGHLETDVPGRPFKGISGSWEFHIDVVAFATEASRAKRLEIQAAHEARMEAEAKARAERDTAKSWDGFGPKE